MNFMPFNPYKSNPDDLKEFLGDGSVYKDVNGKKKISIAKVIKKIVYSLIVLLTLYIICRAMMR
ncbi:MAG: hypothetical protein FWD71_04265 [Oscillospiraceae bacterium]|nr:hypothetical protein [Oscillospiraceae bacterium]